MAKKTVKTLALEPDINFDDTTITMFKTDMLNYKYIIALNNAYNLNMAREDNLIIETVEYPCFRFCDDNEHLEYTMIERSGTSRNNIIFDYYDKMLLIKGRDAHIQQKRIFTDISTPKPEPQSTDLLAHKEWEMVENLRAGIFDIDTFDFGAHRTTSSILPNSEQQIPSKIATILNKYKDFITLIFKEIDKIPSEEDLLFQPMVMNK